MSQECDQRQPVLLLAMYLHTAVVDLASGLRAELLVKTHVCRAQGRHHVYHLLLGGKALRFTGTAATRKGKRVVHLQGVADGSEVGLTDASSCKTAVGCNDMAKTVHDPVLNGWAEITSNFDPC